MSITALTLAAASQVKAASAVPMSIKKSATGWKLVNRYETLTLNQRAGIAVAFEWHKAFDTGLDATFLPLQFELFGIVAKGFGRALANELRQLGLLQCYEGRYWLSVAGLNLVNAVAAEQLHADQNAAVTTVKQVQG